METWFKEGIQSLYSVAPLFSSSDPHEAQQGTADALKEHDLVWRDGSVDSQLHQLQVGNLSLFLLRYGAAVHISPGELKQFLLFQVPVQGEALIRVGSEQVRATPNTGVVLSPTASLDLEWARGCEQLLLKVPRARLEQACADLLGTVPDKPLVFSPKMHLGSASGRAWQHLLGALLHYARLAPSQATGKLMEAHESALIQHLLLCQENNYSSRLLNPPKASARRLRAACHYIDTHLQEAITLADIAKASGSSVRSISLAFQENFQMSPMTYVRQQRLERAHADLQSAAPGTRVTDIAYKWGFNHLGRFCGYYRQRYGQTPLEALQK